MTSPPRPSLKAYVAELLLEEGIRAEIQVLRVDLWMFILINVAGRPLDPRLFQGESSLTASLKRKILRRLDPSVSLQGIYWSSQEPSELGHAPAQLLHVKKNELTRKLQELRMRRTDVGLNDAD